MTKKTIYKKVDAKIHMANLSRAILIILTIFLFTIPFAAAVKTTGHIKLLAVYQEGDIFKGSAADVQLEIKDGEGRVFLETVPLSKMDTQISTRFAKEMACKAAQMDCSNHDFFYTIRSTAGIVGGPSAGGAIAALTFAMLEDLDVDQNAAMTGTINSGGLIGPIGSLKEKLDAAKEAGIQKVLIPEVQAEIKEDNKTDMLTYGKNIGVDAVPVGTIEDAVRELTGKSFEQEDKEIAVPETYKSIMKEVSENLCKRADELNSQIDFFNMTNKKSINLESVKSQLELQNLTEKGKEAFDEENYYSAASYCFGADVKANIILHDINNLTKEARDTEAAEMMQKITDFDNITERRDKKTITDLQTYMIVKERILQAKQMLATGKNDSTSLGYSEERLNSGEVWSKFFDNEGDTYNLDDAALQKSCTEIVAEVDERFQYLNLFFPGLLSDLKNNLITAHEYSNTGNYALCIYIASRTKADANVLVTLLGVKEELLDKLLNQKLTAAKRAITRQIDNGIFPIMAYSYYEYSLSLKEDNKYAAFLYSEYALELSNIDIYFEKEKNTTDAEKLKAALKQYIPTVMLIWGLILGYLLALILRRNKTQKKEARTKILAKIKKPVKHGRTRLRLR